ncbi:hypothetical protein JM16_002748 [Phytophthora kernoviae]|uniref:Macro domain-containing protein n=2 Tax=Phytophthora kernoviae TaxID=325452 RepID=A0A8T0M3Z9_9STRA|nr:hypothetical protein JM16_002748 [Phytophthora kernoviae]
MVSTRSSISLLVACALPLQGQADAAACGADNYSEVTAAVQTLRTNCASWAAYLANGGVWQCDSTCKQSVVNLVDTLPDCEWGGPYGQNYKNNVEELVARCETELSSSDVSTTAPTSTSATPTGSTNNSTETTSVSASTPATTAPSTKTDTNTDTKNDTDTETTNSASTSGSANVVDKDTPVSGISTTSGASSLSAGIVAPFTVMVLVVAGALMYFDAVVNAIQTTSTLHGYLKDSGLWTELLHLHFGGKRDSELPLEAANIQDRGWDWTSRERTCVELQQFLQLRDDRTRFDETVTVVRGNIGTIDKIDGKPIDGIVFPTNPHLSNHFVGSAATVFRRAGPDLAEFVNDRSFRGVRPVGSAVATPGFDAGVQKIIHCVGPGISMADCYELLVTTYNNAMNAVQNENLTTVALASISTGNLSVPCKEAAQVALRTIQKFLCGSNWQGKLAVVCYEEQVLRAFSDEKAVILNDFNATPTHPGSDFENRILRPAQAFWFAELYIC